MNSFIPEETHKYNFKKHHSHSHNYLNADMYTKYKKTYFKLSYNQLLILDALLDTGGIEKKYVDKNKQLRYSEHFGLLDFDNKRLHKIIISAETNREDKDDLEILLPSDLPDIKEYEYMFHTHPPTPYPGSRAKDGILYEFPSVSDIYHFADHFNEGATQGSLVITPEGIYIIKAVDHVKKIIYPREQQIFDKIMKDIFDIQQLAINKYGTDFTLETFYGVISRDNEFIRMLNQVIENYWGKQIEIHLKPRSKDENTGKWILKSLLLPVTPYKLKIKRLIK